MQSTITWWYRTLMMTLPNSYCLRQNRRFLRICFSPCLFVCLFVSNFSQKVQDRFFSNLVRPANRLTFEHERSKVKVAEKVKITFFVISQLLVELERCDCAQNFQNGKGYHVGMMLRPYEARRGIAVGPENMICMKIVMFW